MVTEASRASKVGWTEGEWGCPVSGLQLPSPGASGPLPRQEPQTPIRLMPGGQVQLGLPEKGLEVGAELRPPGHLCWGTVPPDDPGGT